MMTDDCIKWSRFHVCLLNDYRVPSLLFSKIYFQLVVYDEKGKTNIIMLNIGYVCNLDVNIFIMNIEHIYAHPYQKHSLCCFALWGTLLGYFWLASSRVWVVLSAMGLVECAEEIIGQRGKHSHRD